MRRAWTNISPSSASSVTKHSPAPAASHAACIAAISPDRTSPGASDWPIRSAPTVRSSPIGRKSSTALIVAWSISSSRQGRIVVRIATTASAAAFTDGNVATIVDRAPCAGTSRRIARVTIPSVPSLPTKSLRQGQPRDVLDPLAAEGDQGAVGEHHVEPEHVVGGDAVLHAAQAAGVRRDVAADGADLERRGVGRIPEPVLRGRGLHVLVEGAGLDHRHLGERVDLDGRHAFEAEHDATVDGARAAGEPAPRATGDDRHPVGGRPPDRGLHLLGVLGPHDRDRRTGGRVARPVVAVLLHRVGPADDDVAGQRGAQLLQCVLGGVRPDLHGAMQPRRCGRSIGDTGR